MSTAAIDKLIAAGQYAEAFQLARAEAARYPGDQRLLTTCADLFLRMEKKDRAVDVLKYVAEVQAASGSPAKAVVALKKIESIGRGDQEMVATIASRIGQRADPTAATKPGLYPIPDLDVDDEEIRVVEPSVVEDTIPTPLFEDFSRDELVAFISGLQLDVFDPGDIIVAQGDPGNSLFIVTTGILKAFVRVGAGRPAYVRTLHEGDFFGEISLLRGGARTATITAATRCELLELPRTALDSITRLHPRVGDIMRRFAEERLASDRSLEDHRKHR